MEIASPDPLYKPSIKVQKPQILKTPVEKKEKCPGILHPTIFAGHNVAVRLNDAAQKSIIEESLKRIGSNICSETNPIIDIVVSDKPIRIVPMPINYRSRGNRLAAAIKKQAETTNQPQVVLVQQIPWALKQTKSQEETTEVKDKEVFKGIVVADETHVKRPLFRQMTKMPTLYFADIPRGYFFTPFTQPPQDPVKLVQKYENYSKQKDEKQATPLGPADDGFCEICGCSFKDAKAHHESPEHQAKANDESLWKDFDSLECYL